MRPFAIPADAERVTVDHLLAQLPLRGSAAGAGVPLPTPWASRAGEYVQVTLAGTPSGTYPATQAATIRLTAWAHTPTKAKDLANLAQAIMLTHPGGGGIQSVNFLTGPFVTEDTDTKAQLASCTVRVNLAYSLS